MERFENDLMKQLRNRIYNAQPEVKIVVGAGSVNYGKDWIATNLEELNVCDEENWWWLFQDAVRPAIIFAEHVWEHLTPEEADIANECIFKHLRTGGRFRVAVPDGLHPDPEYINYVRPGGTGAGALDHKVLYNFVSMSRMLKKAGFEVELLEYWDGDKNFNFNPWNDSKGRVQRSLRHDERNKKNGSLHPVYTSLIVDAIKPDLYTKRL